MEISVSWLRQHKVVVIASLRSERSLVVRTLGINEVRPLLNFDGLFKTILSSDTLKFMCNNSPGGHHVRLKRLPPY